MPEKETEQVSEGFEGSMSRLEELVSELERGDLSLDHSLKKYEEGIKLLRKCESFLKTAEQRVQILMQDDYGNVELQPFDPTNAAEPSEPQYAPEPKDAPETKDEPETKDDPEPKDDPPPDKPQEDDDDIPF